MYKTQGSMYQRPRPPRSAKILAILILIWSFLFLLIGLGVLAAGTYLYITNSADLSPYLLVISEVFFDVRVLVVLLGVVVTLCSLVSVIGVYSRRRKLLQVYCYSVILLLLLQFGVALFLFINKQNLTDVLHYECMALLKTSPTTTLHEQFFNTLQKDLSCCGCAAPGDYAKLQITTLPSTCYVTVSKENTWSKGCLPAFYQLMDDKGSLQIIIGSTAAVLLLTITLMINCYIVQHKDVFRDNGNRVTPSPSPSRTSTSPHKVGVIHGKGSVTTPPVGLQRIMVREHSF